MGEKTIQSEIIRHLTKLGDVQKNGQAQLRLGSRTIRIAGGTQKGNGYPDISFIRDGKLYLFEVKAPGGRLKPSQKLRHESLKKQGFTVHVVTSLEQVKEIIDEPTR